MVDSILILKSQVIVDSYEEKKNYAHTAKHPKKVIFFAFEASSTYISLPLPGMMDCFLCVFLPPLPMCNCVLATIGHTLKH